MYPYSCRSVATALRVYAAVLLWLLPMSGIRAQQSADVIRGRVTGSDGQPIAGAHVTGVSYFGGITKETRTNRDGRYTLTYPNGEGDYWLSFAAVGYTAQRIQVRRNADEEVLVADMKLSSAQMLQTVTTTANAAREAPSRTANTFTTDPSGGDRFLGTGMVAPDAAGNLAAMAAATPGVQLIPGVDGNPDRFSMFGLDGSQNNSSLNGQQAGLSSIPRDAAVSSQLRAGYDVANGGFSGAQVAINTQSGNNYYSRTVSGVFNTPQAQFNDLVGMATAYRSISLGGRASGPFVMDKDFYNVSFQFDQRDQRLPTLLSSAPTIFQSAGIAADSANRLRQILGTQGIPLSAGGIGRTSPRTNASLLGAFDWAPKSPTSGHAFTLSVNGNFTNAGPQFQAATQAPTALSESRNISAGAQLRHTNYFGSGVLTESMLSTSYTNTRNAPYLDAAGGTVLVTSTLADGSTATRSLTFGGGLNAGTNTSLSFGARNMLSWVSLNNKHRFKLISEGRLDDAASDRAFNLRGRYTYQSLADLEAGRPSSYNRSLNAVQQNGRALIGSIALGDAWRPTANVQVQYGIRLDGNRFLDRPNANGALDSLLSLDNTHVPNRIYASPRVGFSWLYGQSAQIPFGEGFANGPRATIRGGIGLFQNVRGPDLVSNAIANTGLPGAQQQLTCTGAATPVADWDILLGNGAVPSTCADGTGSSLFSNSTPSVTLFANGFTQERSLRSNLQWSGLILNNRFNFSANIQGALNFAQPDFVDRNFRTGTQFTLANEEGRPIFVQPSSIDTASGLIASRAARNSTAFTSVQEQRSDLTSRSGQLTLTLSPFTFASRAFRWSLTYNYLYLTQEYRGFSNTAGDPFAIAWNTASQPRHDIGYTLTYTLRNAVTFSWNGRLQSGQRFTPMIAGDVNGDGRANDRAFVFAPGSAGTTTAMSTAMQELLDHGSPFVRDCLRAQLGRLADRNSCEGPWTSGGTSLRIVPNPSKVRLPQRTSLTFTLSNPLAAADLLLHGDRDLKGWGQAPSIDQSLLYVRGFDPNTGRFRYDVNQRFGATRVQQVTSRTPAILTMQVSVNLAPTRDWQNLDQQLARGRTRAGTKMTEPLMRQMSAQIFPNVMSRLLQVGERIHLSRTQADSLATMSRRYTRIVDSVWTPAAKHLAALPKDYDKRDAQRRMVAARETAISYLIEAVPHVRKMLTKGQIRVLDNNILQMLEPRYLELMRSGQTGGEFFFFF
ncbi:MAG: carboxypeptidase regulatory-like domain-containing protein [Gemmatimonadaceae bacterium]|nr:carboxypeptidase regulatory-like domain-containing protein [Gemmatimonadaceae bacterium]